MTRWPMPSTVPGTQNIPKVVVMHSIIFSLGVIIISIGIIISNISVFWGLPLAVWVGGVGQGKLQRRESFAHLLSPPQGMSHIPLL